MDPGLTPNSLDPKTYYPAFKAHDARLDGRIFVGVSSTGIYCRPVCRARTPQEQNCTFFNSAAAAEAAGYRPCLKCRPELAPGPAPADTRANPARQAALLMEEDFCGAVSLEKQAESLDVPGGHLDHLFRSEYGVSPVQYLLTHKLLLAKSLLTDTNLPAADVALTAGFGAVRRLETLFLERYRMPLSALRGKTKSPNSGSKDTITLYLGYRPPYLWDKLLAFLGGRTIPGVESVAGSSYHRTVIMPRGGETFRGWLTVRHAEKKKALAVTISVALLPVLPGILARVKRLFDLSCEPWEIYSRLAVMNDIKDGLCVPGTRLPGCFDAFEMAVRAVLGQQITVKAARTLAGRLVSAYGTALVTPVDGLTHTFPAPADICGLAGPIEDYLGALGVTGARARSIRALAEGLLRGEIDLSGRADPRVQMKKLLALPGFGPWTVHYVAMRALGWPDAFPHTDYGVKKALAGRTPKEILELSEPWEPWRSYATINLWTSGV